MTNVAFDYIYQPLNLTLLLDCEVDYQPKEPMTRDYPGCPESIEITKISVIRNSDGLPMPDWLKKRIIEDLDDVELNELALKAFHEQQEAYLDAAADALYEAKMLERLFLCY